MSNTIFWKTGDVLIDTYERNIMQSIRIFTDSETGKGNGKAQVAISFGGGSIIVYPDAAMLDAMICQLEAAGAALAMQAEQEGVLS